MATVRTGVAWPSLICWLVILIRTGSSEVVVVCVGLVEQAVLNTNERAREHACNKTGCSSTVYSVQCYGPVCVTCYSFWQGAVLCVTAFGGAVLCVTAFDGGLCYVLQPP